MREYHVGLLVTSYVLFLLSSGALSALNVVFIIALRVFCSKALVYTCSLSLALLH